MAPSQAQDAPLRGQVIDTAGRPVQGASVSARAGDTTSGTDGWFDLRSQGAVQWVTVKKPGFISRTRAAAPGEPVLFRLTPDDGKTIVINFGGDTMFGRRFFDPNEDGDRSDGFLPAQPDIQDVVDLSMPLRPLLENSDLTVLNFESPLTDQPFLSPRDARPQAYHSTKDYVFASHLNTAEALKQSGVDVVNLGNNHMYDLLEEGIKTTSSTLEDAGLMKFGAGLTEAEAWSPAIVTVKGQTIAFIGCTTVWRPDPPISANDVTYTASDALKKGGAARCEDARLTAAIREGKRQAGIVVAMIHGGYEYDRLPSVNITHLTQVARSAGAALVINHHPHVIGGFSLDSGSLTAWSLGNLIFDQKVWPTFESYLLSVYIREGRVIRAYIEPLIIENYVARGAAGTLADYVAREAVGLKPGPFVIENGTMEIDFDATAILRSTRLALEGDAETGRIIPIPQGQWISDFSGTGSLSLGRDLLWIGGFENLSMDTPAGQPPLWDLRSESLQAGKEYAYEGQAGIRLSRSSSDRQAAATGPLHRLLVEPYSNITITGMIRVKDGANAQLQVSWYPDLSGPSSLKTLEPIVVQAHNQWQPFRLDLTVPSDIVAAGLFLKLNPPSAGVVTADFDNLRVIRWAQPGSGYTSFYDVALLKGPGEVAFSQQVLPGAEDWFTLP